MGAIPFGQNTPEVIATLRWAPSSWQGRACNTRRPGRQINVSRYAAIGECAKLDIDQFSLIAAFIDAFATAVPTG
jgi:hypothetical protein